MSLVRVSPLASGTSGCRSTEASADDDDDELMLNVLRCHETY